MKLVNGMGRLLGVEFARSMSSDLLDGPKRARTSRGYRDCPPESAWSMESPLHRQVLTYLQTHHTMTLATVGMEGPSAAALFYVNEGFDLYWLSDPHTRHSENIARTRRAAVTIQEDYRDWQMIQGIQMEAPPSRLGLLRRRSIRWASMWPSIRSLRTGVLPHRRWPGHSGLHECTDFGRAGSGLLTTPKDSAIVRKFRFSPNESRSFSRSGTTPRPRERRTG
jgi:hypothetical protein